MNDEVRKAVEYFGGHELDCDCMVCENLGVLVKALRDQEAENARLTAACERLDAAYLESWTASQDEKERAEKAEALLLEARKDGARWRELRRQIDEDRGDVMSALDDAWHLGSTAIEIHIDAAMHDSARE